MASDLVSLVEAAEVLGVSPERVRQLVVAGDLPGIRFGNAWAVPRASLMARRRHANRRGRPLSARRAWEAIVAGDVVDLSNVSRFRNRGAVGRYYMSGSDVAFVSAHESVLASGVVAAAKYGAQLRAAVGEADLYVPASLHGRLGSLVALVADPLARVVVRAVPDDLWGFVADEAVAAEAEGLRLAPRAAVALDLMESGDPRHWVAAEHLIASDG